MPSAVGVHLLAALCKLATAPVELLGGQQQKAEVKIRYECVCAECYSKYDIAD